MSVINFFGLGNDILRIHRIEQIYHRYHNKFVEKILHPNEQKNFYLVAEQKKISFLAKRFCAKEAFSKALGTGIGTEFGFHDLTISRSVRGQPLVEQLWNSELFSRYSISHVALSLSDEKEYCFATCCIFFKMSESRE